MINKRVTAKKYGQMVLNMTVSMYKVKSKVKVNFNGRMVHSMKVNFLIIIFMDSVLIHGQTEGNTKAIGRIIKWMDKESFNGLMAENMQEII